MAEEDDAGEVQTEEPEKPDDAEAAAPVPPPPARNPNHTNAVYDIPVKVSTVLGVASVRVSKLMKLGKGAVIELDRKVGEPVELYVNDRLVARGELTVTDGRLGITMTEILRGGIKPGES